ncbi:helix-turn-helix transcriptional regulator [Puniceibacterium sediminis]|uniref:Regulatory protein, luxR family n=1 Tax=Puniceibacterium sediminis TaxID=1608407 RepID=A0A238XEQ8_9RHOB|nr:helix-turn-helix transcriptional regulator [Puniceibacterium sediminis]SNR57505.1 regulatory protein, luxR family [Puniceibacterium sediminis]
MTPKDINASATLVLVIAVQSLCAAFYVADVVFDGIGDSWANLIKGDFFFEATAAAALVVAVIIETWFLMDLLRRKAHLERQVSVAAGAFHDVIQEHFRLWALTPSEQDVAQFTIKGMSISEIAALRGSAEGTVKSHLNAIYRKAGVTGRGGLLSLLIEDLLGEPLMERSATAQT